MPSLSKVASSAALRVRALEDWWFDSTRRVKTAPEPGQHRASDTIGPARDGYIYLPVRARNLREALRALPIQDAAEYTFIDLGSGKGRSLFVAAEMPFRRVIGVEYSAGLHKLAQENVNSLAGKERRSRIALVHADAATYQFPAGNLVVYLFNPFGPQVMSCVLRNLEQALKDEPRHAIVLLLWPEQAGMVAAMPGMHLCAKTRRYEIYSTL